MLPIAGDGWFVDTPTGQLGPISSAALERLVSTGEVRLTSLVWHESLQDWAPLQSVLSNDAPWGLEVARPTAKPDPLGGQSEAIRGPSRQPTYGPAATLFSSRRVKITNTLHLLCAFLAALVALLIFDCPDQRWGGGAYSRSAYGCVHLPGFLDRYRNFGSDN